MSASDATNPAPDFFTVWRPHWTSELLGSDYMQFRTAHGIDGLAKVAGLNLDLLFVGAEKPGTGQFRAFIQDAKLRFSKIDIWDIWSPALEKTLERYGFAPCTRADRKLDGTPGVVHGMRWVKPYA